MWWRRLLAFSAILPAAATFYFFVFWHWFDFWTKRRTLTYVLVPAWFVLVGVVVVVLSRWTFGARVDPPVWAQVLGWVVVVVVSVFGTVADRQIGIRVRTFMPFFDEHGHIDLKTTGPYGVVRHPIYAAGSGYQLGTFLVTGYPAVLVAWAVLTFGALWFTRQEEGRLLALLDDPTQYERYRQRVPALLPRLRRRPLPGR
jgi:protein-S-isoprenylcysteine O-methyltransferase Ste14